MLKQIPKASGGDRKTEKIKSCTDATFEKEPILQEEPQQAKPEPIKTKVLIDTNVEKQTEKQKPKSEIIKDLGFTQKQKVPFLLLSEHPERLDVRFIIGHCVCEQTSKAKMMSITKKQIIRFVHFAEIKYFSMRK